MTTMSDAVFEGTVLNASVCWFCKSVNNFVPHSMNHEGWNECGDCGQHTVRPLHELLDIYKDNTEVLDELFGEDGFLIDGEEFELEERSLYGEQWNDE